MYLLIYIYRQPYSSQAKANWSERSRLHQRQLCRCKHWNQTMSFWPPPLHPPSSLHSSSSPSDWFIFLHCRATSIGGHTLSHRVHWSPLWMTFGGWYRSTRVEPLWCSVTLRRRKRWVSSGDTSDCCIIQSEQTVPVHVKFKSMVVVGSWTPAVWPSQVKHGHGQKSQMGAAC